METRETQRVETRVEKPEWRPESTSSEMKETRVEISKAGKEDEVTMTG